MIDDLVSYAGPSQTGEPLFDINLSLPEAGRIADNPTDRMRRALLDFFGSDQEATYYQASILLDLRDYANALVDDLWLSDSPRGRRYIAVMIVSYILTDDEMTKDVIRWSERRFSRGSFETNIRRTKHFLTVRNWIEKVLRTVRGQGAKI